MEASKIVAVLRRCAVGSRGHTRSHETMQNRQTPQVCRKSPWSFADTRSRISLAFLWFTGLDRNYPCGKAVSMMRGQRRSLRMA